MKYDFNLDLVTENSLSLIINNITPKSVILEFGPANGRMTKYLKEELDCEVYIVEIDEEAGMQAAKYSKDYFIGDIEEYIWIKKFQDVKFDFIIFADVLEHLYNPKEALRRSKDLLKPEGSLFVSIPNIAHNSIIIDLMENKFNYKEIGLLDNTHVKFFTYNTFLLLLEEVDLGIVKQLATYSKVEETEFNNSYNELPPQLKYKLKNKEYGEVYQFIFEVKRKDYLSNNSVSFVDNISKVQKYYYTQLFFDAGNGFCEEDSILKQINSVENNMEFSIPEDKKINQIRIDLINTSSVIAIENIALIINGESIPTDAISHNAKYTADNIYIFDTNDPQILIYTNSYQNIEKVVIRYQVFLAEIDLNESESYLKNIYEFEDSQLTKLKSDIDQEKVVISKAQEEKEAITNELGKAQEEKEAIANELGKAQEEKEAIANELGKVQEEKKAIANELGKAQEEKEAIANELGKVQEEKEAIIVQKNQELLMKNRIILSKEKMLESLTNSISWRITKPLRIIRYFVQSALYDKSTHVSKIDQNHLLNIDRFYSKNHGAYITGWAVSKSTGNPLLATIYLKNNILVEEVIKQIQRPDVPIAYNDTNLSVDCGFEIFVPYSPNIVEKIKFTDFLTDEESTLYLDRTMRDDLFLDQIKRKYHKLTEARRRIHKYIFIDKKFSLEPKELKQDFRKLLNVIKDDNASNNYEQWIKDNKPTREHLEQQRQHVFKYQPKISLLTPTYNTPPIFLKELIESLRAQTYTNWELCIADGGSKIETIDELKRWENKETRIKLELINENLGIAGNTKKAYELATGDYYVLLDHDDYLSEDALYEIVKCINEYNDVDFIYSDRAVFSDKTKRILACHYLPGFSPEFLRSTNYASHLNTFSKWIIDKVGFEKCGYDGSQDYELELRVVEQARRVVNIPKVLYYCRATEGSVALDPESKMYAYNAGRKAIEEHICRVGYPGHVEFIKSTFSYRIHYELKESAEVSILIPNKDNADVLRRCINSIKEKTSYKDYEIIIIENNSESKEIFKYYEELKGDEKVKIVTYPHKEFNYSGINNYAINHANGKYVLLLNNDTEVISSRWIEEMLMFAQRNDVGAVGAKLYYPEQKIQHAGLVIGLGGSIASHYDYRKSRYESGYMNRLTMPQNYCAVTGACLMVKKEDYLAVQGLDEENFKIGLNDVDFCLKLRELCKVNVITPYAELYHHESISRGLDDNGEKAERYKRESDFFREKWKHYFQNGDPYHNPGIGW